MKILVLGGSGLVGSRFYELYNSKFEITAPTHDQLDILNANDLSTWIQNSLAEVVINFTGFTNVDEAEKEKDNLSGLAYKLNVLAVGNLAKICAENGTHFIHLSTDYIFDGTKAAPYIETDKPNPVNWYGRTKRLGEEEVLSIRMDYTIVRPEMPYSAYFEKKSDIARTFLKLLKTGQEINGVSDQKITPVFVDSLANALAKIAEKKSTGIYHVASTDFTTPYDFAMMIAEKFELNKKLIKPIPFAEYNQTRPAKRPQNSYLDVTKFESEFGKGILKTVEESVDAFKKRL